jgi:hypothetical protein
VSLRTATAYYAEGFLQERRGLVLQPNIEIRYPLVRQGAWRAGLLGGAQGSLHEYRTGAGDEAGILAHWYDLTWWVGIFLEAGGLSLEASFERLTSPSGSYEPLESFVLDVGFDDAGWAPDFSLQPWATLYVETLRSLDDLDPGTELSFGLEPTWELPRTPFGALTLRAPLGVAFSLGDFFQDETGRDHRYGYTHVGLFLDVPLAWPRDAATLTLGAAQAFFGTALRGYNERSRDTILVLELGFSF